MMRLSNILAFLIPVSTLAGVLAVPAAGHVARPVDLTNDRIARNQWKPQFKQQAAGGRRRSEPSIAPCPTGSIRQNGRCVCSGGSFGIPGQCQSCNSVGRLPGATTGLCGSCKEGSFQAADGQCQSCNSVGRLTGTTVGTCGSCKLGSFENGGQLCQSCSSTGRSSGSTPGTCGNCNTGSFANSASRCQSCSSVARAPGQDGQCGQCFDANAIVDSSGQCSCPNSFQRGSNGQCVCKDGTSIYYGVCQSCTSYFNRIDSTHGNCGICKDGYVDDGYGTCKQCVNYNRVSGVGGKCGACVDTYRDDGYGAYSSPSSASEPTVASNQGAAPQVPPTLLLNP